ncbi:pitrilysin family protein [Thalassobaculum sp. OXR-137]|uniref:M16 family metallopeptidase n=1 Tax=Thalassobaculum sp. OXR-137 TaxID=3100173 RepID=UPI002AC9C231|nr:pitrilysin family protein [Thalassobaculum sp. OXR-137]WPZ37046.1 pitrilysin family protein [Thalassobaculum sp. OXR-137]
MRLTTLDNGLTVATDAMPSVESASVGLWVGVGTRHEKPSENGLAHLIEHMVFKGTAKRDAAAIAREIEDVGGHMNAYTSREQTAYYAKVLADDVPVAIDLISDIVQNSVFDPAELDRERAVIVQEIAQVNDTPDDVIFDHFQTAAFPDQGLGRPVLGTAEVVRSVPRQSLVDYVAQSYGADSCILSVAGRVDHDRVVELAAERFSAMPSKTTKTTDLGQYAGGEIRVERELEQLHVILGFRGTSFDDPDFYTLQVLSMIYGGGMSSRLFQEVREKRGLAYSIYSFTSAYLDDGLLGVYAGTGADEVGEVMPVICDQLRAIPDELDESELARAKIQLKSSLLMSRESTSARCEQLANHFLVHGRLPDLADIIENVEKVDPAAIRAMVERLLSAPPTLTAVGPTGTLESYDAIRARLS